MVLAFCSFASYRVYSWAKGTIIGKTGMGLYPKFREDQFIDYNGIIFIPKMTVSVFN